MQNICDNTQYLITSTMTVNIIELPTEVTTTASSVLPCSQVRDLRRICVDGKADHLKLSGKVRSYYHKQLAQETVRGVARGMRLVNQIQV